MTKLILFTDGSCDTRSKTGYGAYLAMTESELSEGLSKTDVKVKRFDHTSSTKLELETLLWALDEIGTQNENVIVYTDSQNIVGLSKRRGRLEKNDYRSNKGKRLRNHKLYRVFFKLVDDLNCEFVKVHGHLRTHQKDDIDRLFNIVDRASRRALREFLTCKKIEKE